MLPEIDGHGVWQWILTHRPLLTDRVIFMTGDTLSAGSQQFLEGTGRPVLDKPLAMDRLGQMVDAVLVGDAEVECAS